MLDTGWTTDWTALRESFRWPLPATFDIAEGG